MHAATWTNNGTKMANMGRRRNPKRQDVCVCVCVCCVLCARNHKMQNMVETCKVIAKMQEQLAKQATYPQMCQHWGQHWQDGSKMRSTLSRWNSKCPRWAQDGEEGARRKAMTETCQKHSRHASTWANNRTRMATPKAKMGSNMGSK